MSLTDRVLDALVEVTEADELRTKPDARLFDERYLDSVRTVELILLVSSRFGIDISPAEFDPGQWATPRLIAEYLQARVPQ